MILKKWMATIIACLFSVIAFAQEKGLDVDIDINKEREWYQQPWVWIVGGAIFILLLAAILRGGGRKEA